MRKIKKSAYLLIAHGTREEEGKRAFFQFVEEFQRVLPARWIQPAFLELVQPSIAEGIENCVKEGAQEIFVLPLMLFPGRHINKDIPERIQEAKRYHPEVDFHYSGALALATEGQRRISEPKMLELLSSKIARLQHQLVNR